MERAMSVMNLKCVSCPLAAKCLTLSPARIRGEFVKWIHRCRGCGLYYWVNYSGKRKKIPKQFCRCPRIALPAFTVKADWFESVWECPECVEKERKRLEFYEKNHT